MNEELTPWFYENVKPVRKGVYEVAPDFSSPWYAYFDGNSFGYITRKGVRMAEKFYKKKGAVHTYLPWRGLANDPNKKVSK